MRSMDANNTAVLYNGVQITDAQNGQIDLGKFSLNNIREIVLYNAQFADIVHPARNFSAASVLSIKTIIPDLSAVKPYRVQAGIKAGSFGLINPYLQWQQRINKRWSVIVNGSNTSANGRYKYKVNGDGSDTLATRKNSDVSIQQADAALYWTKSDSNKFNVQFNYYHSNRGLPGPVVFYTDYLNQRLYNRDYFAQAGYEHIAKNSFHFIINSKYTNNYGRYINPDFLNNSGGIDESYTQREYYQSVVLGYNILANWKVSYSADLAIADLNSNVYDYAFPTRYSLYNVVATDVKLGKLQLQGNLLNTYITEHVKSGKAAASRSVFTPTLTAMLKPFADPGFQLRAFYKDVFRNPTFSEQYYYATVPRSIRPERAKQYDIGATYGKSPGGVIDFVMLTADAYYNNVSDKIIYVPTRSPETPSVRNLGKVDIRGLDVTLKTQFAALDGWQPTLTSSYTYQKAIDVTNPSDSFYLDQIPYTPKHTLTLNGGLNKNKFGIYYNYIFSSARYDTSNNLPEYYVAGYGVSDASAVYSFVFKKQAFNVSAEVNNLFNKNYDVIRSYPMPGRSFRFTFQITI